MSYQNQIIRYVFRDLAWWRLLYLQLGSGDSNAFMGIARQLLKRSFNVDERLERLKNEGVKAWLRERDLFHVTSVKSFRDSFYDRARLQEEHISLGIGFAWAGVIVTMCLTHYLALSIKNVDEARALFFTSVKVSFSVVAISVLCTTFFIIFRRGFLPTHSEKAESLFHILDDIYLELLNAK